MPPPYYDVNLGGIDLPTFETGFSESVGSEYQLVGAAVMPGPPRPSSMYSMTINVYGDQHEVDFPAIGLMKRLQVRSMLQNPELRFSGLQFTVAFDPDLDGWIVIGTADIAYGTGGPGFGDFTLAISGAAKIPAQQSLQALVTRTLDLRTVTAPLDHRRNMRRDKPLREDAVARHFFPVGATLITGQAQPVLPETGEYETIYGPAPYVDERPHRESLTFEQPWQNIGEGDVRVHDRMGGLDPVFTKEEDEKPGYGWARVFGPAWSFTTGDVPVLDNGRCRFRYTGDGRFLLDTVKRGRYVEHGSFDIGYKQIVRAHVESYSTERAVVSLRCHSGASRSAVVYIALQRGWPGPTVDIYHQGDRPSVGTEGVRTHVEAAGSWEHHQLGVTKAEALIRTASKRIVLGRF